MVNQHDAYSNLTEHRPTYKLKAVVTACYGTAELNS